MDFDRYIGRCCARHLMIKSSTANNAHLYIGCHNIMHFIIWVNRISQVNFYKLPVNMVVSVIDFAGISKPTTILQPSNRTTYVKPKFHRSSFLVVSSSHPHWQANTHDFLRASSQGYYDEVACVGVSTRMWQGCHKKLLPWNLGFSRQAPQLRTWKFHHSTVLLPLCSS